MRGVYQLLRFRVYLAHGVGHARVADPAAIDYADVHADDIALVQHLACAGYAVADDVVDGDADRRGEGLASWLATLRGIAAVAFIDRNRALASDILLGDAVQFSRRDAWNDMRAQNLICLRDDAPCLAQLRDLVNALE